MDKREKAYGLIKSTNGKIFSVTFTKKGGEQREMVCRLGVTKHLQGGEDNKAHLPQYINVFEMASEKYKTVTIDTITKIGYSGNTYTF
jgi:hypothetical protein